MLRENEFNIFISPPLSFFWRDCQKSASYNTCSVDKRDIKRREICAPTIISCWARYIAPTKNTCINSQISDNHLFVLLDSSARTHIRGRWGLVRAPLTLTLFHRLNTACCRIQDVLHATIVCMQNKFSGTNELSSVPAMAVKP